MESTNDDPTPAAGKSNVKHIGVTQNELRRLEALPPANRASPLERDGTNVKWKGLTILKHTGKIPRIVKGDVMQGYSSRKTRLVELSDEETSVEKRCEVVGLECDNGEKQTCESEVLASIPCFNTMGLVKKRKVPESQGSKASSVLAAKGNGGGDKKEASASAFLSQVKEKLNAEEYNKFIGYMQALKRKELKLANVMQSIVQLFCGKERNHLLVGFKDFVPVKYRAAYEECIKTRKREA